MAVPGTLAADGGANAGSSSQLIRAIDWRGAFWVASGVPALVLFSIGGIAGVAGKLAFLVWFVSMIMGLIQSFTYAEIAGLFPNKSGGASIYGAAAWVRYSKIIAPSPCGVTGSPGRRFCRSAAPSLPPTSSTHLHRYRRPTRHRSWHGSALMPRPSQPTLPALPSGLSPTRARPLPMRSQRFFRLTPSRH